MRNKDQKYYSMKELSQLAQISVRTLHFYDEIKLLEPESRSSKGHRLYSENDLTKLQQILILKSVGCTLKQIKTILKQEKMSMLDTLKIQMFQLQNEMKKIKKVLRFSKYLINQYASQSVIDWTVVTTITETNRNKPWYENYLTAKELKQFNQFAKKRSTQWLALFAETKNQLHIDPKEKEATKLINKWILLAEEAYQDHPTLLSKLWEGYKAGFIPTDYFPYNQSIIAYLSKALEINGRLK